MGIQGGWERKKCFVVHQKFMEGLKFAEIASSWEDVCGMGGEKELAQSGKCERGRAEVKEETK